MKPKQVLDTLQHIAATFPHHGSMLNEHHLHHHFTHLLQQRYSIMDLSTPDSNIRLHTE